MSSSVLLVGAGFSAPFGIPTMRPFYERFLTFAARRYPRLAETLGAVVRDLGDEADLERLLEGLTHGAQQGRSLPDDLVTPEIRTWAEDCHRLTSHLMAFIVEQCERFNQEEAVSVCGDLVRGLSERNVAVFTTNYDRIIEHVAQSVGTALSDGFQLSADESVGEWSRSFSQGIRLAKLHGSVTWYQQSILPEPRFMRLDRGYPLPGPDFHLSRGETDLSPLMIIPTLEKEATRRPYSDLKFHFGETLRGASLLVVIGSSLRDEHLIDVVRYHSPDITILVIGQRTLDACAAIQDLSPIRLEANLLGFLQASSSDFIQLLDSVDAEDRSPREIVQKWVERQARKLESAKDLSPEEQTQLQRLRGDSPTRVGALNRLRGSVHPTVLAETRALAESDDADTRLAVIENIAAAADRAGVPMLIRLAESDGNQLVRLQALLALKSLGTDQARSELARLVKLPANSALDEYLGRLT